MRKANKIVFGIASALLAATMITTSAISTTFAKYVSSSTSAPESARAAQWGGQVDDIWNGINTKIKPGTSGELIRVSTSGISEVAHEIDLEALLDVDAGYKRIDAGKDYFPILITVGVDGLVNINGRATDVYEKHFYMGMNGGAVDTLDELIEEIRACAASDEFSNIKVDPNQDAPLEFYVKWQWFYNDAEIDASSLNASIKTALKAYQSSEKDTLIGEAMRIRAAFDAIIAKEGNDVKYETLKILVEQYKDVTDPTEDQVTALSNALADFFGETTTEYRYTKQENYDIRWRGIINSGHKTVYDPYGVVTSYGSYFDPAPITDSYMYTSPDMSVDGKARNNALCNFASICFYSVPERNSSKQVVANGATIPLVEGLTYEYYFKAKNSVAGKYAGVVFAIDQNDIPYFLYGAFTNGDTDKGDNMADLSIGYDHYPHPGQHASSAEGFDKLSAALQSKYDVVYAVGGSSDNTDVNFGLKCNVAEENDYGLYKIVYEGFNVSCYYKDATDGEYKQFGTTITLPEGSRFSVGVLSRKGYENYERTVQITGASFVQEKEIVSVSTTFNSLMERVQSVITACENGPFDIQADLNVTMQQISS